MARGIDKFRKLITQSADAAVAILASWTSRSTAVPATVTATMPLKSNSLGLWKKAM
jgi:hypothetical protein